MVRYGLREPFQFSSDAWFDDFLEERQGLISFFVEMNRFPYTVFPCRPRRYCKEWKHLLSFHLTAASLYRVAAVLFYPTKNPTSGKKVGRLTESGSN